MTKTQSDTHTHTHRMHQVSNREARNRHTNEKRRQARCVSHKGKTLVVYHKGAVNFPCGIFAHKAIFAISWILVVFCKLSLWEKRFANYSKLRGEAAVASLTAALAHSWQWRRTGMAVRGRPLQLQPARDVHTMFLNSGHPCLLRTRLLLVCERPIPTKRRTLWKP